MKYSHIGVDIIEIYRIRDAVSRWGDRFLRRVYTVSELELYHDKVESLAVRFAGKEAAMKALNTSGVTLSWLEVEILSEINGKPLVNLYGQARDQAQRLGLSGLEVSLSHSRENAIAFIIGIKKE
jgi:holo-[acyl-carrier protein] synthase